MYYVVILEINQKTMSKALQLHYHLLGCKANRETACLSLCLYTQASLVSS